MERYRAASHPERIVCRPSATALWYREQVAPLPLSESVVPIQHSAILYEHQLSRNGEPSDQCGELPKANPQQSVEHATVNDILAKIRTPYDEYERYLVYWLKRLKRSAPNEETLPDTTSIASDPPLSCSYLTTFGSFDFVQLVERTRKYAASVLRNSYQVNEADIDDGVQAGYLRLWQKLQAEPQLLADKSLAWIGKGIIFTALHATHDDWQFRRHTQTNEEVSRISPKGGYTAHSWESRQADIRADLYQAVECVEKQIRTEEKVKQQDYALWALFGLVIFQISASETSRLVGVREQSIQAAYTQVKVRLQKALPNYAPSGKSEPFRRRGRESLPEQDVNAIRKGNGIVSEGVYETVREWIERTNANTRKQDEIALEGLRYSIPASVQSRTYEISQSKMQRAYIRVSLLIGAERDPTIRIRRPEHRVKSVFTLTEESAAAVEHLALELLKQPKSYEKLVALYAHISNLAISTTAKFFNIPTSTLRYYTQQIGAQLGTLIQSVHEGERSIINMS
ncbi:MAG: hypothetical protein K8L97_30110 [Anaerolineae bacterium]|nr:hypothetical protein [Anaerolineae bacterium]